MRKPILLVLLISCFLSCSKLEDLKRDPDLTPLKEGFLASAAIAYCVSLASKAYTGQALPANVTFTGKNEDGYTSSGLIYVNVDQGTPLPFNSFATGQVVIAGLWDGTNGGVISILFANVDVLDAQYEFYGLYTIPVYVKPDGEVVALFAEQDIVVGNGSETLLELSLSKLAFNGELDRLDDPAPSDIHVAVTQNVWHLTIKPGDSSDLRDDVYEIDGGGQIIKASNTDAGVFYHAMINTRFSLESCDQNPIYGTAFIQNIQAGSVIDFGTILLDFHNQCDGRARVTLATGEYAFANRRDIALRWN